MEDYDWGMFVLLCLFFFVAAILPYILSGG